MRRRRLQLKQKQDIDEIDDYRAKLRGTIRIS